MVLFQTLLSAGVMFHTEVLDPLDLYKQIVAPIYRCCVLCTSGAGGGCEVASARPVVMRSARARGTKIPVIVNRDCRSVKKSTPSSPRHVSGQIKISAFNDAACSRAPVGRPQPSTPACRLNVATRTGRVYARVGGVAGSISVDSVNVTFGHRLWWVDAFIGEGARGNPAVVVLLERSVSDDDLQQIAFELGVSETAFIRRVGDGWSLRWFTPTVEVDLCGHATLATLHVLLSELGVPAGEIYFQTRAGVLSGRRLRDGMLGIDLPRFYLEPLETSVLNGTLGAVRDVYQAGPQSVLAVVENYDALCGLAIDPMSLFLVPGALVIAACVGGPDADVSIRVFAPRLGLAEDPVTGSALCAVSPWWVAQTGSPTVVVRQASTRGGVMFARLFEKNVEVAGYARTFFGGDLRA
jgi:predicted PhzF superfamily epimerase YddE/YHI9